MVLSYHLYALCTLIFECVGSVDVRHGRLAPIWPGTDGQQYFHWIANLLTIAKEVVSGTGVGWLYLAAGSKRRSLSASSYRGLPPR